VKVFLFRCAAFCILPLLLGCAASIQSFARVKTDEKVEPFRKIFLRVPEMRFFDHLDSVFGEAAKNYDLELRTLRDKRSDLGMQDSIAKIEQTTTTVRVSFEHGSERTFDLVIGADGLHSRTRQLAFGSDEQFEAYLGYKVAAFEAQGYRPRDELVYVMYTEVGQQVSRFAMRDDRTMFLFTFADQHLDREENDEQSQKAPHRRRVSRTNLVRPLSRLGKTR